VRSPSSASVSIGPFGDTFTWPPAPLGAVATKNRRCLQIQSASLPSIAS
jgi:hypothetical protein